MKINVKLKKNCSFKLRINISSSMDDNIDANPTPKRPRPKLGLRKRSNLSISRSQPNNESNDTQNSQNYTPTSQGTSTVLSVMPDINSASKILERKESTLTTPRNIGLKRLVESTNCRPYRLSLNKNIREKLTKKRLEFHLANDADQCGPDDQETNSEPGVQSCGTLAEFENIEQMSRQRLIERIRFTQKELSEAALHRDKVKDLKKSISIWKQGFAKALDDLQEKIQPPLEKSEVLNQLGIDQSLLQYAND